MSETEATARPAAPSSSDPLPWPERPETLPLLPLVCVAWEDRVLDPVEFSSIRRGVDRLDGLEPDEREALLSWLRPEEPPSAVAIEELRRRIRDAGLALSDAGSLTDLGLALARAAGADATWTSPAAVATLSEIEGELGVLGRDAARDLLDVATPAPAPPAPPFDPDRLARYLAGPYADTRNEVLRLLALPEFRKPQDLDRAAYREWVWESVRRLARKGLGSLAFPTDVGGRADPGRAAAVFETLAHGDLSVLIKFGVQFGLFGGSIHHLGTRRHHEAFLQQVASGDLPGCFAMTEAGHGSNVRGVETTATYDADREEFVIHTPRDLARKHYIGNAACHGRMASVFAQLAIDGEELGVHVFLVPLRDAAGDILPGIHIEDCGAKVGLNGVDNGMISFDQARIPRENLLDRFAAVTPEGKYTSPIPSRGHRFFTMLGTLVAGRISIAAAALSISKTALTIAVRYSHARRQFGPTRHSEVPILDYLVHQRALLPRLADTYALNFAIRRLVGRYVHRSADDTREVEVHAAALKAFASWHAMDTIQACREACGGEGYLSVNRFGDLRADTDIFTTFEGANPVLLQLTAKGLLTQYREEMSDLKVWDIMKYVAERAGQRMAELNPVVGRRTDEAHLRSPEFHSAAFAYREDRLLMSVARRLKARIDQGQDSFDAMNACQDHLVTLALAHVDNVVLRAFQDAIDDAPDDELRDVVRAVYELFALSRIERHRGWYLETGYVEGGKARAVRTLVNRICGEVRPHATALVAAFGIPDEVLAAPAAFYGGNA